MQHTFVFTGKWPDSTRWDIKVQGCDRAPVESPISRSTILLNIFENAVRSIPPLLPQSLPLHVEDARIAFRMRDILGIPQKGGNPYYVLGKTVNDWIKEFESSIGLHFIEAEYIVGSSSVFIAGQPLFRESLDVFLRNFPDNPAQKSLLFAKISRKISHKVFSFADVDLRIKVNENFSLEAMQKSITKYRTDLFYGKVLIIYIGEKEKNALDIVVYKELDAESSSNIDDLKIDILHSDLNNDRIAFVSNDPWKLWKGQALGVYENNATDGFRSLLRHLWQISKGKYTRIPTEGPIFKAWKSKIEKTKTTFKTQFDKHQANHDRLFPLAHDLLRLSVQRLILFHSPESKDLLREVANKEVNASSSPFIKAIFHAMQEKGSEIAAIHKLIECVAYLAIYDAWQNPFEVKFVWHEGEWTLRIRFRGTFGKRDLLVRCDFPGCLTFIRSATLQQWEKMRAIIHSLWFDGPILQRRFDEKNTHQKYRNLFPVPFDPSEIRKKFLSFTNLKKHDETLINTSPLAFTEIESNTDPDVLVAIFYLVLNHYFHDPALRNKLCWKIVDKCISSGAFTATSGLVKSLRVKKIDPPEGYRAFFANLALKGCDSYLLYQACSPFPPISDEKWVELAKAKDKARFHVVALMNEMDITADLFLEMTQLLKIFDPEISESLLLKIILHDKKEACQWILRKDNAKFASPAYVQEVSQHIIRNKQFFKPFWMKDYILFKRFVGSQEDQKDLCEYLLSKPLDPSDKANLLQTCDIKDSMLWQKVANEYLAQGADWPDALLRAANFNGETLVKCQQIIQNANNYNSVLDKFNSVVVPPMLRTSIIIRILKNWTEAKAEARTLILLDPSERPLDWVKVINNAETPENILTNLSVISLPWYSSLFRSLKPQNPSLTACWVKMVQKFYLEKTTDKLLEDIKKPVMTDCLLINPQGCLPVFKRLATQINGIEFILEILEEAEFELIQIMIETCIKLESNGTTGGKVFTKYFDSSKHKKLSLMKPLANLAKNILTNPQGDMNAAGSIWKIVKDLADPEQLPSREQLLKLIHGYPEWVIHLLNKAKNDELEKISPDIYCRLISKVKDLDNRCVILLGCRLVSERIQEQWEIVAQADRIDAFSAIKLLKCAQTLQVEAAKVQKFAQDNLGKCENLEEHVLKYLIDLTSKLNPENAYKLWETLLKSKKFEKMDLWNSGYQILNRNPHAAHYFLLKWLVESCPAKFSESLLHLISKIVEYPMDNYTQMMLLHFVKSEMKKNSRLAREIYWKLDCDENISQDDLLILNPTAEETMQIIHRLIDNQQEEQIACHSLQSVLFLYEFYRLNFKKAASEEPLNAFDYKIFHLMCSFVLTEGKEKQKFWVLKMLRMFDLQEINLSPTLQQILLVFIENEAILSVAEKKGILECLIKNNILIERAGKLIKSMASSDEESDFLCALRALDTLEVIEWIPTSLVTSWFQFSDCIPQIDKIVQKLKDSERKDYLNALLIGAWSAKFPIKETALKYIEKFPMIFSYIDKHLQAELKEFKIFTNENQNVHSFRIQKGSGSAADLFYIYVANVITCIQSHTFYDPDVLRAYMKVIDTFVRHPYLRSTLTLLMYNPAIMHADINTATLLTDYFFQGFARSIDQNKFDPYEAKEHTIQSLLIIISELMVKFAPMLNGWKNACCSSLFINSYSAFHVNEQTAQKEVQRKVKAYSCSMALKGTVFGFHLCTPKDSAYAITVAIKFLCKYPNENNLRLARQLLQQGVVSFLFLFPERLHDANACFIQASLANIDLKKLPTVLPQLFSYLCDYKREADCFEMTRDQINSHLKESYEKSNEIPLIREDEINLDKIRNLPFELIDFNVCLVANTIPLYFHCFIGFLNVYIFAPLVEKYKKYPEHTLKLMEVILFGYDTWSKKALPTDKTFLKEMAVLFCCHSFVPCDSWATIFSDAGLDALFEDILSARKYSGKLEKLGNDKHALLQLKPPIEEDSLDNEISLRYQWLYASRAIFKKHEDDPDTLMCMKQIQVELKRCLNIAPKAIYLSTISVNILHFIIELLDFNEKLSRINPTFANEWVQSFIAILKENYCKENKWLYSLVEENLQMTMTLELLPSLKYLEEFSSSLSEEHKARSCVEAYHRLISLGCKEDVILNKAISNLDNVGKKVRFLSHSIMINAGSTNVQNVPDPELNVKLNCIFFAYFNRLIERFKEHKNSELFLEDFQNFESLVSTSLEDLNESREFLNQFYNVLFANLGLFSDFKVCEALIKYVNIIMKLPSTQLLQKSNVYIEFESKYFNLILFMDALFSNASKDKYVRDYVRLMEPCISNTPMERIDKWDSLSFIVKVSYFLQHGEKIRQIFMQRALKNLSFQQFYFKVLVDIIKDMDKILQFIPVNQQKCDALKVKVNAEADIKRLPESPNLSGTKSDIARVLEGLFNIKH